MMENDCRGAAALRLLLGGTEGNGEKYHTIYPLFY